jgi:hypothetical protein
VAGDEFVEVIDESLHADHAKEVSQRPGESQLREECDTAAGIAGHECSVR